MALKRLLKQISVEKKTLRKSDEGWTRTNEKTRKGGQNRKDEGWTEPGKDQGEIPIIKLYEENK